MNETNNYGVPYHEYEITLLNGEILCVDIGIEEDWGDIQECVPDDQCANDDWTGKVGWGNDADGHIEIVKVVDCEFGHELDPLAWANDCVWCWADAYSS